MNYLVTGTWKAEKIVRVFSWIVQYLSACAIVKKQPYLFMHVYHDSSSASVTLCKIPTGAVGMTGRKPWHVECLGLWCRVYCLVQNFEIFQHRALHSGKTIVVRPDQIWLSRNFLTFFTILGQMTDVKVIILNFTSSFIESPRILQLLT